MSALRRPEGDEAASKFGAYMSERTVCKLAAGDTFEVLCDGGIHYLGKVASIDDRYNGTLHFCKWNEKFDIECCFKDLYLAPVGTYSTGTLNGANQYINPNESNGRRKLKPPSESDKDNLSFADKTRYDDDFLSRPYRTNRKRRSMEGSEQSIDGDNKKIAKVKSGVDLSFDKEKVIKEEKPVPVGGDATAAGSSTVATVSPSLSTAKRESPAANQQDEEVPEDVSLDGSTEPEASVEVVMTEPDPPSAETVAPVAATVVTESHSSISPSTEQQQIQHCLLPASIPSPTSQASQAQGSSSTSNSSAAPDPSVKVLDELPKPPAPVPLIVGSRNMQRWRQYYQEMLAGRKEKACRDAATAMAWLDAHMETLRQRGKIKGKVHGPLGMLCMTEDRTSAVILEHGFGQSNLLAFMVDRLMDQIYLEDEFRGKQNLDVRVMFSGTRDRFQGYRSLSSTQRRPHPDCQLWNLADALTCGQLIRNCLHSEGCTSQTKLGGKVASGVSPRAMLRNLFLVEDSASPVLYISQEDGGQSLEVQRFFLPERSEASSSVPTGQRYHAPEEFQAEVVYPPPAVVVPTNPDVSADVTSDSPARTPEYLMFSYEEQLALLETIPASLPTPQVSATTAASAFNTSKFTGQQYHNSSSNARNPLYSQRLPNFQMLDEQFSAERAQKAVPNRNSVGATAVWHMQSQQAGIFYPSRMSVQIDLVSEYTTTGLDGAVLKEVADPTGPLSSRALGWFVPLSSFLPGTDVPSMPITLAQDYFGNTWPLEHAAAPPTSNDSAEASERAKDDTKPASAGQPQEEGDQTQAMVVDVADKLDNVMQSSAEVAAVATDYSKDCEEEGNVNSEQTVASVLKVAEKIEGEQPSSERDRVGAGTADGAPSAATVADGEAGSSERAPALPHLSLHRKTSTFGLSFLDKQSFLAWHEALSQDGEMEEFPEIPPSKVAFISLASMRMNQDYYDLKLLKRKHVTVFLDSKPVRTDAAHAAIRTATSSFSGPTHSGSNAIPNPLPLTVFSSTDGHWQDTQSTGGPLLRRPVPFPQLSVGSGLGINSALPSDAKTFRSRLSVDTMIGNLQRAVDSLGQFQADLQASGVDTAALHKLLAAQLQLARASRLMLR